MAAAKLGQHFLINRGVANKIVDLIPPGDTPILEIGPGEGVLTSLLSKAFPDRRIVAVEKDGTLAAALTKSLGPRIQTVHADLMTVSLESVFGDDRITVVGNIPYYISKRILDWILGQHERIQCGVMMMQREFVKKIIHRRGRPIRTPQAVLLFHLFRIRVRFDVQPGSFRPPPGVVSSVITLEGADQDMADVDILRYYDFVRLCFANRRKTMYNNLRIRFGDPDLTTAAERTAIDLGRRSQDVHPREFLSLFLELDEKKPYRDPSQNRI
jgi:16S rRNA (adenine1518-N6/adenine1519-N6)-dimethyltransferase